MEANGLGMLAIASEKENNINIIKNNDDNKNWNNNIHKKRPMITALTTDNNSRTVNEISHQIDVSFLCINFNSVSCHRKTHPNNHSRSNPKMYSPAIFLAALTQLLE